MKARMVDYTYKCGFTVKGCQATWIDAWGYMWHSVDFNMLSTWCLGHKVPLHYFVRNPSWWSCTTESHVCNIGYLSERNAMIDMIFLAIKITSMVFMSFRISAKNSMKKLMLWMKSDTTASLKLWSIIMTWVLWDCHHHKQLLYSLLSLQRNIFRECGTMFYP